MSTYLARGILYRQKGDHDRAVADFGKAIELAKENASGEMVAALLVVRGGTNSAKGNFSDALSDYQSALTANPNNEQATNGVREVQAALARSTSSGPQQAPASKPGMHDQSGFIATVLGNTEEVWHEIFRRSGESYTAPTLRLFTGSEQGVCGFTQAVMGPFYCPNDKRIYLDTSFFSEVETRFRGCEGKACKFSHAYVIAHEVGHHVQNLLGVLPKARQVQQAAGNKVDANLIQLRVTPPKRRRNPKSSETRNSQPIRRPHRRHPPSTLFRKRLPGRYRSRRMARSLRQRRRNTRLSNMVISQTRRRPPSAQHPDLSGPQLRLEGP